MLRRGGYGNKFLYRAGRWPALPPKKENVKRIWIQAVSVGELSSLAKLLDFLLSNSSIEDAVGFPAARYTSSENAVPTKSLPPFDRAT